MTQKSENMVIIFIIYFVTDGTMKLNLPAVMLPKITELPGDLLFSASFLRRIRIYLTSDSDRKKRNCRRTTIFAISMAKYLF